MMKFMWLVLIGSSVALAVDKSASVPAEPAAVKSAAVVSSTQKRDLAVAKAKKAYREAVIAADRQLIDELDAAMSVAMKGGTEQLDQVKAIDAAKVKAKEDLKGALTQVETDAGPKLEGSAWRFVEYADATVIFRGDGTLDIMKGGQRQRVDKWTRRTDGTVVVTEADGPVTEWAIRADGKYAMVVTESKSMGLVVRRIQN